MNHKIQFLKKKYWPRSLLEITPQDVPKKLRIRGENPNWSQKRICIVGSRKYSDYGRAVCEKIINELSTYPITIVSGLAYGIDSIAHRYAIKNGMNTIAIPGSGLDDKVIYPKAHLDLAERILENGGCLISEYSDMQEAANWTFPQRNRIMAGISDIVLIIEAAEKSGTMITARLALDYNIEIGCVPGSVFSVYSQGTNKLLRQGAQLITCGEDILNILGIPLNSSTEISKSKAERILSTEQLEIFNLIEIPLTKRELLDKTNIDISELNKIISVLEIEGLIHTIDNKICQK